MADSPDIQQALREAVDRTVRATADTRERAQGAAGGVADAVDDLLKGAERNLTRRRRSVRSAVGDRLPATQEDVRGLRDELRRMTDRLEAIEARLASRSERP
jgi:sirohydrochlorin ferrochelatase